MNWSEIFVVILAIAVMELVLHGVWRWISGRWTPPMFWDWGPEDKR